MDIAIINHVGWVSGREMPYVVMVGSAGGHTDSLVWHKRLPRRWDGGLCNPRGICEGLPHADTTSVMSCTSQEDL